MIPCSPILLVAAANALARHAGCKWEGAVRRAEGGRGSDGARFVQLAGMAAHYDSGLGISSWPLRAGSTLAQFLAPLVRADLLLDEGSSGDLLVALDRGGSAQRVGIVIGVLRRRRSAERLEMCECDVLWGEVRAGGGVVAVRQRGWFGASRGYRFAPWYLLRDVQRDLVRRPA